MQIPVVIIGGKVQCCNCTVQAIQKVGEAFLINNQTTRVPERTVCSFCGQPVAMGIPAMNQLTHGVKNG